MTKGSRGSPGRETTPGGQGGGGRGTPEGGVQVVGGGGGGRWSSVRQNTRVGSDVPGVGGARGLQCGTNDKRIITGIRPN